MPSVATELADTIVRTFRVSRKDIWYLHFIFEAYDGVATVSTVDSREGIVEICIPARRDEEAALLLQAIGREIPLEECDR
jgi:hypothetical protein